MLVLFTVSGQSHNLLIIIKFKKYFNIKCVIVSLEFIELLKREPINVSSHIYVKSVLHPNHL